MQTDTPPPTYELHIARRKQVDGRYDYQQYRYTPSNRHSTLVNALEYVQAHVDRSLMFRRSCFHGSCGTCGVILNGKKVLACLARLAELPTHTLYVQPLSAFPIIGDLAVNPARMYAQFPRQRRYLRQTTAAPVRDNVLTAAPTADRPAPPAESNASQQLEQCIECGLCETACPIVAPFMGPAALAAHYREIINNPQRTEELLTRVGAADGVAGCKSHYECSKVCPTGVYPSGKIAKLRKRLDNSV